MFRLKAFGRNEKYPIKSVSDFFGIMLMKVFGIEKALIKSAERVAPGLEKRQEKIDQLTKEINCIRADLLASHEIYMANLKSGKIVDLSKHPEFKPQNKPE